MIETPVPASKPKSSSMLGTLVLALAGVVAVGGLAFAVGRVTAPAAAATATTGFTGRGANGAGAFGNGGFGNGGAGGNGTGGIAGRFGGGTAEITLSGTVVSISASDLTLKLANGTTVAIPLDRSTTYHRQGSATASDVSTGSTVEVALNGFGGREGGAGASPGATPNPNATPSPNRTPSFGPARDITITTH